MSLTHRFGENKTKESLCYFCFCVEKMSDPTYFKKFTGGLCIRGSLYMKYRLTYLILSCLSHDLNIKNVDLSLV